MGKEKMPTTYTIELKCTDPAEVTVASGDKVIFKNSTGASKTISIKTPGFFNPSKGSVGPLADGASSSQLTVGNTNSSTDYEYADCGQSLGTLSGRIRTN